MQAKTHYYDLTGTVSADVIDDLMFPTIDFLKNIGEHFKINEERFNVIGLSFSGVNNMFFSLICVDLEQSTPDKDFIVKMHIDIPEKTNILSELFKQFKFNLYDPHDIVYPKLSIDKELIYSDYHE